MKIPLSWVKQFTDIKYSPNKLKERLSVSLTEVEDIEKFGEKYKGFVTAEVVKVEKHPKSQKLLVLTLDIGGSKPVKSVVRMCEVKQGDITVFIKPGLKIPTMDQKVGKVDVKGVKSEGFVPSGRELGLSYEHTTIYTLPEGTKVGVELSKVLELDDSVLEIKNKTLTHRPDCFGVYGVAREIAAIQKTNFKELSWLSNSKTLDVDIKDKVPLRINNEVPNLCGRYVAVVIKDVDVKPSPHWLQVELSKIGIHPVNNIVDITNYFMILTGQPSHAFDYDKLIENGAKEAVVTIRKARKGEKITTIDGKTRDLDDTMLVISNDKRAVGIAGVMGGKESEIDENTKNVIYQAENMDMYNVRRTSMKLGLFTDAVTRLSKGMDPNLCKPVVVKAAEMMKELSGGKIASDIEDDYRMKTKEGKLTVDPEKIRTDLGVEVENAEIKDILQRLGLGVKGGKIFELTIPTFRADLKIPEDINEEVARIYGYDKVEPTLPVRKITPVSDDKYRSSIVKTKKLLSSFGANEMYTYSFVSKDLYKNSGLTVDGCYKLVNAISPELVYMRPLIFPSLLEKVPGNYKNFGDFCSFEVDIVDPCKKKNRGLPEERWHLGVAHTQSFYHLKLYLEHMLKGLNVSDFELIPLGGLGGYKVSSWIKYAGGGFHPLRSGLIRVGKDIVGIIGEIDVAVRGKLDLPSGMSVFELDMDYLSCYIKDTPDYILVSKYPTIVRDYSFVTAKTVLYKEIYDSIRSVKSDLIRDIDCLDIYSKKESDEKKTTFRITYQSNSKTLESEDIDEVEKNIISNLKKKVHGRLAE